MRKNLPYKLGVAIPSILILGISAGTVHFILVDDARRWITIALALYVAFTYCEAIRVSPGHPEPTLAGQEGSIDSWCTKCRAPKPERTHHCRQCGRCILKMDHHCPWTLNCVGHKNLPHFLRFVTTATLSTGYALVVTVSWLWDVWNLPGYQVPRSRRIAAWTLVPFQMLVVITVGILWLRVAKDILDNSTQIEGWEQERVSTLVRRRMIPRSALAFPFDIGYWGNIREQLGGPLVWLFPWSQAPGDGHRFTKAFQTTTRWPPESEESRTHEYYRKDRWISFEGENLADFGVETDESEAPNDRRCQEDIPLARLHDHTISRIREYRKNYI